MKNRFAHNKRSFTTLRDLLMPILVFVAVAGLFLYGISSVGAASEAERLRAVEQAVTKAAVQCYAVEGRYPPSLSYLEEHYGLMLDHGRYIIQYDIFASNMMPTIWVLPVDFEDDGAAGGWEEFA